MSLKLEKDSEESWLINPLPGYVYKWKSVKIRGIVGDDEPRKCFVNVCHCEQIPPPIDDLDENEVADRMDRGDDSYRIPISIGSLDCVKDRKEENSVKIDVLVNTVFYQKRLASPDAAFFRQLLALIFVDMIKEKHDLTLDPKNYVILRNRCVVGDLESQRLAKKPAAKVVEEVAKTEKTEGIKEINEDEVISEMRREMFGMRQIDGVRIRLFDGKRLEISMRCEAKDGPISDPKRLKLKLNPTRCLVILDKRQSLFDFGLPFQITISSARSKFIAEKHSLVVSADIFLPS